MKLRYKITSEEKTRYINSEMEVEVKTRTVEHELDDSAANEFIANYIAKDKAAAFIGEINSCKNPPFAWNILQEFFREEIEDYFRNESLNCEIGS